MEYDAENPRFMVHHRGEPVDRHRVFFNIKNKDKAIQCYKDFQQRKIRFEGSKSLMYLVLPEEVFVKYGDIEAAKYYEQEEQRKKEREELKQAQLKKT